MSLSERPEDIGYYGNARPELAARVPVSAMTVLDVGCGVGQLGRMLKAMVPGRRVFGIEVVPGVAAEAERVLDRVIVGDVQTMEPPFPAGSIDCMVFADVLEHLPDPAAVLRRFTPMLSSSGTVLCSIPNMRHYTSILRLIRRGWIYDDFGLFDRTHLRFFSRESMHHLLEAAGLTEVTSRPRIIASRKMRLLNFLAAGRLEEFLAFQYILLARLEKKKLGLWPSEIGA